MSTSPAPVIEYVASVSAITYTALSPVTEYVAPAPVVTYAAASWDIDYVSHSNWAQFFQEIGDGTNSTSRVKEEKKDPMMRCTFFIFLPYPNFVFFLKITGPSNNFEF